MRMGTMPILGVIHRMTIFYSRIFQAYEYLCQSKYLIMHKNYIGNLLLVLLIAFVFNQCMSPENPKNNDKRTLVTENVKATKQTENGDTNTIEKTSTEKPDKITRIVEDFTLYIPKGVNEKTKAPVVFIFDPHGNGQLPIGKYKNLADEFGFVLVASNKSQNGQAIEDGLKYYNEMKTGISEKANIDTARIFVMGFSGGARVAVSIAIQQSEINAVIGCGAGFPAVRQLPKPDFYYVGMVGYEDFNMIELINNDRQLARSGFKNELVIFDGGHDWPDEAVMREAFLAIQINDARQKIISKDEEIIRKFTEYYNAAIKNFVDNDRYFDAAEMASRAASILKGVGDAKSFESQEKTYKKNQAYSRDLSAMVKSMETENGKQNNYMSAFSDKDMAWWNTEIKNLKTPVEDLFQERLNKRLLSYLGLMSYMMSNKAIQENDMIQAQKNIDIYRTIEPANPEHAYLNAIVKMNIGDEAAAEGFLQQAIVLGFNNTERFLNETAFDELERKNQFLKMMN